MALFYNKLKKVYETEVPSEGLAVFRIGYAIILLFEVIQLIYFRKLIFDPVPFLQPTEASLTLALYAWAIAITFIIFGLFTRYAIIANLFMSFTTFSVFSTHEYHLDYSITGLNTLLLFLPISKSFSLDNLFTNRTNQLGKANSTYTSLLYYYIPVLLGIGVVYFDSIFWKFGSYQWTHGLGFWKPASLPISTYLDLSPLLNNEIISLSLGYITLIFELVFIFLIWNKVFKPYLIIIGVGLHIGILIAYPIPLFALGAASIYTLLVDPYFWKEQIDKLRQRFNFRKISILNKIPLRINKEVVFKISSATIYKMLYSFIIYSLFAQALCILQTPIVSNFFNNIGLANTNIKAHSAFSPIRSINKLILGITSHPVFMDMHFDEYNHLIAVTYIDKNGKEEWLPIISEKGQPSYYATGRQWVRWTFRANAPSINQEDLKDGLEDFTAFWAGQNNVPLGNAKFIIKVKKFEVPTEWKEDFLKEQLNNPWTNVGEATWVNNKFSANIPVIENL